MNAIGRREGLITVLGFAFVTGTFLFAFYFPGYKTAAKIKDEIKAAETSIRDIPLRVAELESLKHDHQRRKEFLEKAKVSVPEDPDVHGVIEEVAVLAKKFDLQVTRLEPLTSVPFATFQQLPFRLNFSGKFRGIASFLKGLEDKQRLFTVQEFTLKQKNGKADEIVEGEMHFSVYVSDREISDSAGNNGTPAQKSSDIQTR